MALWRSGYAAVCKTVYTGSIPVGASNFIEVDAVSFLEKATTLVV